MLSTDPIARVILHAGGSGVSVSAFDVGLILTSQAAASFAETKRLKTYSSAAAAAAGLVADGFAATDEVYKAAMKYFASSPAPASLLVSVYPDSETPSEALDTVLDRTAGFYGVFLAGSGLTDADYLTFEEHVRSAGRPLMLFLPAVGTDSAIGDFLDALKGRATRRAVTTVVTAASDAAAVMGKAMGLALAHPASAFSLCYQTISAIEPMALTESQVAAFEGKNGNVYITRGYNHLLLEKGATAEGARYEEVLYLDMISDELNNAAVDLLVNSDRKLPQTDDTTAQFINRFSAILSGWYDREVLATGPWRAGSVGPLNRGDIVEKGYMLWADSYDEQSDADRAAHKSVPIQVALVLAGSVESIVITVNVSI